MPKHENEPDTQIVGNSHSRKIHRTRGEEAEERGCQCEDGHEHHHRDELTRAAVVEVHPWRLDYALQVVALLLWRDGTHGKVVKVQIFAFKLWANLEEFENMGGKF